MYVAVKGGQKAIANAHKLVAKKRRGDKAVPEITPQQINEQLALGVDRVMAEGSLYDRELAALAIKQARGDLIEAIFLVRAYRTTLPRFGYSEPVETGKMQIERRVSATYKDLPGGQVLGPTFDYTHRLIDFALNEPAQDAPVVPLGKVQLTECEMVNQFHGSATEPPQFTRGYGLVFGQLERKAMSMALVDRALRARELGEDVKAPAQDEEFVLSHSDNVQATGFVEHLKLPHYVDFQAELGLVRKMREEFAKDNTPAVREAAE